ncbi:Armadillo-type fold [Phytophthora cactorum]|nr:Armadillo-type fold [Phytophthora cactorum]
MHKKRVVHGDLKLNNILVGADGQAKLSDFGLSSVSGSAAASEAAIAGGLRWRAPEYLTHAPTFASDVYSFAMCMIEAEIGNPPFAFLDDDGVRENLRDGTIPDKPDTMSSDEWDLVVSMTNVYPAKRISLLSVLEKLKRFAKQEATANPDGAPKQTFAATQSLTSAEVVQSSVVGASNRIAELLDKIAVARDDDIKQSLLKLVRECLNDDHRTLLYEADGIQILSNVAVPKSDVVSLLNALQKGTDYEKEQALIRCVCITSRGIGGKPLGTKPVSTLLRSGSDTQKLWVQVAQALVVLVKDRDLKHNFWAAEALGNLAADNEAIRSKIARKESITALVTLIQVGNDEHKHRAAYALGEIALSKAASEMIVQNGAIPSLVGLVRVGTEQQKKTAMSLLGILLRTSYTNRAEIEREKSVAPLIALTLLGSDDQKSSAAIALQRFSSNTTVCDEIAREGGIVPLIALLQSGSDQQNEAAAGALMNLANDSETSRAEIGRKNGLVPLIRLLGTGVVVKRQTQRVLCAQKTFTVAALETIASADAASRHEIGREGGITPLIKLLGSGTEEQKTSAAGTLEHLTHKHSVEIGREGVEPLIALVRSGSNDQKKSAAVVLGNLARNAELRTEIGRQGGVEPLVTLLQFGSGDHKDNAAIALENLAEANTDNCTEIVRTGGVAPLVALVEAGTDAQKVSAVGTLSRLSSHLQSDISLGGSVASLVALLKEGTANKNQKLQMLLQLWPISMRTILAQDEAGRVEICREGAIGPLVGVIRDGPDELKCVATDILALLAGSDALCSDIAREGGVAIVIKLLREGTEELKVTAAGALKNIANNDAICGEISREGGAGLLTALLGGGTDEQKAIAAGALARLAWNNEGVRLEVQRDGAIAPLLDFIKSGTHKQKTNAADALRSLAKSDVIRAEICHYRGAERMLKLLKTGLDEQKAAAAGALESFAWNEEMNSSIVCEGGIPPLVQLLRSGNQVQKTNAAGALASILRHNGNAPGFFESGDQGAISSLIALLETGTDEQKNSAAVAVGCLTTTWDNCADIERRGGVDLLIVLSKTGTQEQKRSALNALVKLIGGLRIVRNWTQRRDYSADKAFAGWN